VEHQFQPLKCSVRFATVTWMAGFGVDFGECGDCCKEFRRWIDTAHAQGSANVLAEIEVHQRVPLNKLPANRRRLVSSGSALDDA